MMFTGTKERVEFTSEHVFEVPKELDSNQKDAAQPQEVNQTGEVPKQQQRRKASPEVEEPRHAKVR